MLWTYCSVTVAHAVGYYLTCSKCYSNFWQNCTYSNKQFLLRINRTLKGKIIKTCFGLSEKFDG